MGSTGGLYITANTTAFVAPNTAAKYTTGWVVFGDIHGDCTITEDATNSMLTLLPGRYLAILTLTVETEDISGTSGDDAGIVTFGVRLDGVQVTGMRASLDCQDSDRPHTVALTGLVEVDAGATGALEVYVESADASGNDICVTEGQFVAMLVD